MSKVNFFHKRTLNLGAIVIAFIACYHYTFIWINEKYLARDSYYSHGYLIPLISLYIVYSNRDTLKNIPIESSRVGLFLIITALCIHIVAMASDINFISGFSILIYIIGCCLYFFGNSLTRSIAFPLFFLIFMFPIPNIFINTVGLPTKSLATDLGVMIVKSLNIPVLREGFRIILPKTSLLVGTPCNGMKSLIAFAAVGALAGYYSNFNLKKLFLLLLSIYPLAIGLNGLRIAALIYIANQYGIDYASPDSIFHDAAGIIVFLMGTIIMFTFVFILKKSS